MTDDVEIQESELDELKSKIEEQEVIIKHVKGYAFGLESKNIRYLDRIDELKEEMKLLEDEIEMYKSSTSWKITKPLRAIMDIFRK